jgi:hypothetical protein
LILRKNVFKRLASTSQAYVSSTTLQQMQALFGSWRALQGEVYAAASTSILRTST